MIADKVPITKEISRENLLRWGRERKHWCEQQGYDETDPAVKTAYLDDLYSREGDDGFRRESELILSFFTFEQFVEMFERNYPDDAPEDWDSFKIKWGDCFCQSL